MDEERDGKTSDTTSEPLFLLVCLLSPSSPRVVSRMLSLHVGFLLSVCLFTLLSPSFTSLRGFVRFLKVTDNKKSMWLGKFAI